MGYAIDRLGGGYRRDAPAQVSSRTAFLSSFIVFTAIFLVGAFHFWAAVVATGASVAHVLILRRPIFSELAPVLPLMAVPIWAALSTVWSTAPLATLSYAGQFCITVLIALILARTVSARTLLAAFMMASVTTMVVILALGIQESAEGGALIGGMGSHTATGARAALASVASVAAACDGRQSWRIRVLGGIGVLISLTVLIWAESAGGIVLAIGSMAAFVALSLATQLPRIARGAALIVLLVTAPVAVLAIPPGLSEEITASTLRSLGRDPTLTKRTELWTVAEPLTKQRPLLGRGYGAFWAEKSTETIGIWRRANRTYGAGFHFHNSYIEVIVGLGYVGLALLAATVLIGGTRLVVRALQERDLALCFFASMLIGSLMHATAENVLTVQVQISTLTVFMACCMGVSSHQMTPPTPLR